MQANNNHNSVVAQGGGNVTVHLHQRRLLPARPIDDFYLQAARLAWAKVAPDGTAITVPARIRDLIAVQGHGLAVVSGAAGTGRTAAAVKALAMIAEERHRADPDREMHLEQLVPDWDPPDTELLPLQENFGYVLDVSPEISGWHRRSALAKDLVDHGKKLAGIRSCLILIVDKDGWPAAGEPADFLVRAARPSPRLLCRAHLSVLYRRSDLAQRLDPATDAAQGQVGLAHLVKEGMHPSDAAELARLLGVTDRSESSVAIAVGTFNQWLGRIKEVFDDTRDNPDDRALLLAAVFLEGCSPSQVQRAARILLDETPESDVRRVLSGMDLASRLQSVGAEVVDGVVTFRHLPGFGPAVLRHVWTQLSDVQSHLTRWIGKITAHGGVGADCCEQVADLLAGLAISENDTSILPSHQSVARSDLAPLARGPVAARMLATAAQQPVFGAKVREQLRDRWAMSEDCSVAEVAALVCQEPFAKQYPKQALVRLRWVLDRHQNDSAVQEAERALLKMAADSALLPDVWSSVVNWTNVSGFRAGRRAFLSLVDPKAAPDVLRVLITDAEQDPRVVDELITAWSRVLSDPELEDQCEKVLAAWAQAVADGYVASETVVNVLHQVVTDHLFTGPMSSFLMGKEGVGYPPAVIAMRHRILERQGFAPADTSGTSEGAQP